MCDFCSVQGAIDFLPALPTGNVRRLINIKNGTYQEIVYINAKSAITFLGQDRQLTNIGYANNDNLNPGTSLRPSFRAQGDDLTFLNLTFENKTPHTGTQAEA